MTASTVAVVFKIVRLELDEDSLLAHLTLVNAEVTARAVGAVEASPSRLAVARKVGAELLQNLSNLVHLLLVSAASQVGTVVGAVGDRAIQSTEVGITPAGSIDALPVTAALSRALLKEDT